MKEIQTILGNLELITVVIAAILGVFHFLQVKDSYWKWFVFYLIFIAVAELFSGILLKSYPYLRKHYYDFFIIPIEFLFYYWLFAKKSLQNDKLFKISCIVYLIFFVIHLFILDAVRSISAMSYTVGVFFLAIMVYLEFMKQIKSDEILNYQSNKMFYVNIGVLLFYVGTLPFFAFDKLLYENNYVVWDWYKTFFLLSVNVMYLLFSASFIWGKPKL